MAPYLSKYQKVGLALALLVERRRLQQSRMKKRRVWTKRWLREREKFSHMRLLEDLEEEDLRNFLRIDGEAFLDVVERVRPYIERKNTNMRESVSVEQRVAVTLRYLATGRSYEDLKFGAAISPQLLGKIIPETCEAICHTLKDYIRVPENREEWRDVARRYEEKWNFPNCIGAIDGKHVAIQKPPKSGSTFFNYKHFFSLVLFAVVNADYEFMYLHVGTNGSASDAAILKNSSFYKKLMDGALSLPEDMTLPGMDNNPVPHVLIGDSAFGLNKHVMKPFPFKNISHQKRIFNYRLSRARRVVENTFGILASRFRVLRTTISLLDVDNIECVVRACCFLHNYWLKRNPLFRNSMSVDTEDTENCTVRPGNWRDRGEMVSLADATPRQRNVEGNRVRDVFTDYFNGVGAVSFQERMIDLNYFNEER